MIRRSTIRRDANEAQIISGLRAAGAAVQPLDGDGIPDLLVSFRGVLHLLEVKLPLRVGGTAQKRRESEGGRGDLTAAQVRWWSAWTGKRPAVVRSITEALQAIGASP